jgi:hypothetical protein
VSNQLTVNQVAQFDAVVKQAYQQMGRIRRTLRVRTGVVGATHQFQKIGQGTALARVPQTDVTPMNVAHNNAVATLTDWIAPEYTDIFNQQKVNYSERAALGRVIAGAIGRREDQLAIDALDAETHPNLLTAAAITTARLRRTKRLLDEDGVDPNPRFFLISAHTLEDLLGVTEAVDSDFNVVKTLVNGEMNTFVGFEYITIDDRANEGGLPKSGNNRTHWAFHGGSMGAIGLAVGIDFRTEVNYVAQKTSWLAAGLFSAGAVVIDLDGCVEVVTTEST